MIKTGRTKIDTKEKMALARENCKKMNLDAIVVVGGDDSNTNAAFLAQELFNDGIQVIGVPKPLMEIFRSKTKPEKFYAPYHSAFTRQPELLLLTSTTCVPTAVRMSNTGMSVKSWAGWPATLRWKSLFRFIRTCA